MPRAETIPGRSPFSFQEDQVENYRFLQVRTPLSKAQELSNDIVRHMKKREFLHVIRWNCLLTLNVFKLYYECATVLSAAVV